MTIDLERTRTLLSSEREHTSALQQAREEQFAQQLKTVQEQFANLATSVLLQTTEKLKSENGDAMANITKPLHENLTQLSQMLERTNAVSMVFALLLSLGISRVSDYRRMRRFLLAFSGIVALIVLILVMLPTGSSDSANDFKLSNMTSWFLSMYSSGEVVYNRPELNWNVGESVGILDVIGIIFSRIKWYFSLWFSTYSTGHKLINLVQILPIWILSASGVIFAVKDREKSIYPIIIGATCYFLFQVVTALDFDLRYRCPIFPLLFIISTYSCVRVYRKRVKR